MEYIIGKRRVDNYSHGRKLKVMIEMFYVWIQKHKRVVGSALTWIKVEGA